MFGLGRLFENKSSEDIKGIKITDIPDLYKTKRLKLEIIRQDKTLSFNVQIRDMDKKKNQLHLSCQYIQRDEFEIQKGDRIKLIHKYYRGILEWECSKVKKYKLEYLDILVVEQKKNMKRVNQREFFRINLRLNFKYELDDKRINGELEDISYTGMKFNTKQEHEIGVILKVYIGDLIEQIEIVRSIGKNDYDKFVYGAKFSNPNEKIEKYVNKKQLDVLGKK